MTGVQKILVVDDEDGIRDTLRDFLSEEGYAVSTAIDYDEAVKGLDEEDYDLIFSDIVLGGKSGIDLLREVRRRDMVCPVVMITGYPTLDTSSEAVRLGAFDYLPKPVRKDTIVRIASIALRHKALADEKERYRSNLEAIFQSARDAIITVDSDLHIIEVNKAALSLCGLQRDEAIGKNMEAVLPLCSQLCVKAIKDTMADRQAVEIPRIECLRKEKQIQVVSLSTYPLLNRLNQFSGVVMMVRDETELAGLRLKLKGEGQFHKLVGASDAMKRVYAYIEALSSVETTVLITGESGTGKELVAEALHAMGPRAAYPLVKVNCSALTESLLESELFGHVRGAFTGAVKDKEGRFERARGGILFLDEIGDISHAVQLRLLRVLQEMEFERVGDSSPIRVDVRVVAATNKDLKEKVKEGSFREDLYYRLKVVEVHIPPLRERQGDIPLLIEHFLSLYKNKMNREIDGITSDVQRALLSHHWPGNVRELQHVIEHSVILCRGRLITLEDLPNDFIESTPLLSDSNNEDEEKQVILSALEKTRYNRTKAAKQLGISRRTIQRKIKAYNLDM